MSEIESIVYSPQHLEAQPPACYTRIPLESARLIEGRGIEGDRKGNHPERQLNIMSAESLAGLSREGYKIGPGEMGEQIIIQGLDVDALTSGDRIQIGAEACVEVVRPRTGCDRFERIQGLTKEQASGCLGMMAKVVTGGTIRVGDSVTVMQRENT
jgi:MOSC domain-containing protein YiiM